MATRTWNGATGSYTDPTQWSGGVVPGTGDTAIISSGTVNAGGLGFVGVTVQLNGAPTVAGTLNLSGSTFDANTQVVVSDTNDFNAATAATIGINGTSTNNGTITFTGTSANITFATGAALVNNGLMAFAGSSPQFAETTGAIVGSIVNNGTIQVTNPSGGSQAPRVNANITGTGTITIGSASSLDLVQAVGSGQSVTFTGGVNSGARLEIDAPTLFAGTIGGFVSGERLIFTNLPYTSYSYTSTGASSGTLTLLNGSTAVGSVNLAGIYGQNTFSVQANPLTPAPGQAQTYNLLVSTNVINPATGATLNQPMYRFFDTKFGTHLFTNDVGEANNIKATRTDLKEETNNFGSVAQSDVSALPVFRFFNLNDGTHFYTSSQAEATGLTTQGSSTYRADLSFEPNSTLYEHATQQSGDLAVHRLFDSIKGTQFLTGDQGEYNGIVTPGSATYRADLKDEGIAFYAPAGSFFV